MKNIVVDSRFLEEYFDDYLDMVMSGIKVVVTHNGKEVGYIIPKAAANKYLADNLTDIMAK